MKNKPINLIARENMQIGDYTIRLWINYCRLARNYDSKILGVVLHRVNKGKRAKLIPIIKSKRKKELIYNGFLKDIRF